MPCYRVCESLAKTQSNQIYEFHTEFIFWCFIRFKMTFGHFLLGAAEMKKVFPPIEKAVSEEKNDSTGLFLYDNGDMETPLRENPSTSLECSTTISCTGSV